MSDLETRGRPRKYAVESVCDRIREDMDSLDFNTPASYRVNFPRDTAHGHGRRMAQGVRTSASLKQLQAENPNHRFPIYRGGQEGPHCIVVISVVRREVQ